MKSNESKIEFILNSKPVSVTIDSMTPLLWVIRDYFSLTGTKYSCGKGICGVCTVLVNGKARQSCLLPVKFVQGSSVLTIEGLPKDASHPCQKAWINARVSQCGYCQPGQIMSAVSLLDSKPNPTDKDIDQGMSGNLCRCGTYPRIKKAVRLAAQYKKDEAKQIK